MIKIEVISVHVIVYKYVLALRKERGYWTGNYTSTQTCSLISTFINLSVGWFKVAFFQAIILRRENFVINNLVCT